MFKKFMIGMMLMLMLVSFSVPTAQAEWYAGWQLGSTTSTQLSGINVTGFGSSVTIPDQTPSGGLVYGAKVGYYAAPPYKSLSLGLESEVFITSFSTSYTSPSFNINTNLGVTTLAPLSFMLRYKMGDIEPYAGVGPAVLFSHLAATASTSSGSGSTSSSSVDLGFMTKAGIRYKLTEHYSMFGEWKYTQASMQFSNSLGSISGDYSSQMIVAGFGYHF